MSDVLTTANVVTVAACGGVGGLVGAWVNAAFFSPHGRRRGPHRRPWQRVPPSSEAETEQLPVVDTQQLPRS
ncbi:hypothetical protein [Streptomyces sp. NPDC046925]|uniref:hypothetical protein n=1 Tax=Streptomyces sp. NPDC046925 TaxID=3155375 RepID=UPI0033D86A70